MPICAGRIGDAAGENGADCHDIPFRRSSSARPAIDDIGVLSNCWAHIGPEQRRLPLHSLSACDDSVRANRGDGHPRPLGTLRELRMLCANSRQRVLHGKTARTRVDWRARRAPPSSGPQQSREASRLAAASTSSARATSEGIFPQNLRVRLVRHRSPLFNRQAPPSTPRLTCRQRLIFPERERDWLPSAGIPPEADQAGKQAPNRPGRRTGVVWCHQFAVSRQWRLRLP